MSAATAFEPVRRSQVFADATPAEAYAVVTDFEAYPRLFPEISASRVLSQNGQVVRVEFRVNMVIAIRYVLDLVCDPEAATVRWTFVEGEGMTENRGGWSFSREDEGTRASYEVVLSVKAPVPNFVLKKVTDGLVSASLPKMFTAVEKEIQMRRRLR